jgi:PKD repeat protein
MSGSAGNGADYQTLSGSVTIPAGASSANITVTPIDDTAVEGNETSVLTLSVNANYTVGSPNSATVTIADNDQPPPLPTVSVTAGDANASESGGTGTFSVARSGSTASALTVFYSMSGSAGNGADYQTLSDSVTISAGASSANITVTPIEDTSVEGNETVVLTLAANAAYTVGSPGSATVTIADNDQPPPLTADFTASPLLGIVPLVVQFTDRSTGNPVSWEWDFGDGSPHSSAQNPSHIYILPGTYTVTLTVRNSAGATSSKSATIRATLL